MQRARRGAAARLQGLVEFRRQVQQRQVVGHRRQVHAEPSGDRGVRLAGLDAPLNEARQIERRQAVALLVLGDLGIGVGRLVADDDRHFRQAGTSAPHASAWRRSGCDDSRAHRRDERRWAAGCRAVGCLPRVRRSRFRGTRCAGCAGLRAGCLAAATGVRRRPCPAAKARAQDRRRAPACPADQAGRAWTCSTAGARLHRAAAPMRMPECGSGTARRLTASQAVRDVTTRSHADRASLTRGFNWR